MPDRLVLLHGFSQTRHAWDGVLARLDRESHPALALDLPGHGDLSAGEQAIDFELCVRSVLSRAPAHFDLCGYSLGGRVAMHIALAAPERLSRLVLISTSPGIEDAAERAERRAADRRLAGELERVPFEEFIHSWRAQPLFAHDPPAVRELAIADQRRNRPEALARVLRGVGAGEMEPLWMRLRELRLPVQILVGDRDTRYLAYGERMASLLPHGELRVLRGGHSLPLENPDGVAGALARRPVSRSSGI